MWIYLMLLGYNISHTNKVLGIGFYFVCYLSSRYQVLSLKRNGNLC